MPTVYKPPKNPPPAPKEPSKVRTIIAVFVLTAIGTWAYFKFADPGPHATKATLAGHWMHIGDGITVELFFDGNGRYHRFPKEGDIAAPLLSGATSIPESGEYFLDDTGHLGFASGGSFIAFIRGTKLTLEADGVTPTQDFIFSKVD